MPKGKRVFLAHSSIDKELVRKLYRELKKRGLQPWLDEEDLLPGQDWTLEIPKAIRRCDYFIACLSKSAIQRQGYMNKEFRMALDIYAEKPPGSIYLIPLKFNECDVPDIQHPELGTKFRNLHWLDYWKSDGLARLLKALAQQKEGSADPSEPTEITPENDTKPEKSLSKKKGEDASSPKVMPSWVLIVSVASALVFIAVLLMLAVLIPHPSPFQMFVFRIVLALAAAAFGATIPGFFKIQLPLPSKGLLHAGGALGLFVLIFLVNPPELISSPEKDKTLLTVRSNVSDARVYLDDLYLGSTEISDAEITPGWHQVRVEKEGYQPFIEEIEFKRGQKKLLRAPFISATSKGQAEPEEKFTNSLGMEFALISPGTFLMGSPESEEDRSDDETQHEVTLTQGYYLQTTEVTQGQWQAVMGNNPSHFKNCGENCPVENISWEDVQAFIQKLNQQERDYQYRLPTEAEWEYAARASTTTPFSFGNTLSTDQANYDSNRTTQVKSFPPNAWGLYDMHGNVWEWCQDWYGDYPSDSVTDPQGPPSGDHRVLRGGSWVSSARLCRSAVRLWGTPGDRHYRFGFRLVAPLVSR